MYTQHNKMVLSKEGINTRLKPLIPFFTIKFPFVSTSHIMLFDQSHFTIRFPTLSFIHNKISTIFLSIFGCTLSMISLQVKINCKISQMPFFNYTHLQKGYCFCPQFPWYIVSAGITFFRLPPSPHLLYLMPISLLTLCIFHLLFQLQ